MLTNLQYLSLYRNDLTGTVDSSICDNNIYTFRVDRNEVSCDCCQCCPYD